MDPCAPPAKRKKGLELRTAKFDADLSNVANNPSSCVKVKVLSVPTSTFVFFLCLRLNPPQNSPHGRNYRRTAGIV